jgi:prolipoprotein diacylglyceryltransferase
MLGDLLIAGLLLFFILRWPRREGVAFFGFLLLYAAMRFGVSELRLDSRTVIAGLTTPQVTSLFIIPVALLGVIYCWRRGADEGAALAPATAVATGPPAR